jgi:hypothetical protein
VSTRYVELADRVFSITITPDTPGHLRRQVLIAVESGPGLTEQEYKQITASVVADLVSQGVDVIGWEGVEGEG